MTRRNVILSALLAGAGSLGLVIVSLVLWLLLGQLGDEQGAAAAQILAIVGGIGMGLAQFLLVTLLALGALRVKMYEGQAS